MINNFIQMISSYSSLIQKEGDRSWNGIDFSQDEPLIIKEYLLSAQKGVDYLNHHISKVITDETNYELKFASVFCHQKPRVKRTIRSIKNCTGDTLRCELGDLMIVFVLLDKNKKKVCSTAKILQAKKGIILNSKSQKCLYESDLEFDMPKNLIASSTSTSTLRTLPNYLNHRNKALSYLILNNGMPLNREIPFQSNLSYGWSHHLQLMLELKTGLEFNIPTGNFDIGWNCIVNDLLNVGIGKVPSSTNRGYGLDYLINSFNFFFFFPEYRLSLKDPGIPKLMIFCKDTEREFKCQE